MFTKIKFFLIFTIFGLGNQITVLGMNSAADTSFPAQLFLANIIKEKQEAFVRSLMQLKIDDENKKTISQNDLTVLKRLWYNLLTYNPSQSLETMEKSFQKTVKLLSHPDKYKVSSNKEKMTQFFADLTVGKKWDVIPALTWHDSPNSPKAQGLTKKETLLQKIQESLQHLKTNNDLALCVTDQNVADIKALWDAFKAEHNYDLTWVDQVLNRNKPKANLEELTAIHKSKQIAPLLHSDKYSPGNRQKMDELFKYLSDASKPTIAIESAINWAADFSIDFGVMQSEVLGFCLLNKVCPRVFRNYENEKLLSRFDQNIASKEKLIHHKREILKMKIDLNKQMRS